MTKVLSFKFGSQSKEQYGPRPVGEILHEFFNNSDSPLAKEYRKFLASKEISAEKGVNKHE